MTPRLRAAAVVTKQDEFRLHLQNASRYNFESPSNRALRAMLRDPKILDWLEQTLEDAVGAEPDRDDGDAVGHEA